MTVSKAGSQGDRKLSGVRSKTWTRNNGEVESEHEEASVMHPPLSTLNFRINCDQPLFSRKEVK
jgi:hypothetical protein